VSLYVLNVRVTLSEGVSCDTPVYINIIDTNDNSPVFTLTTYSTEVFENASIGTSILHVSATDMDIGK